MVAASATVVPQAVLATALVAHAGLTHGVGAESARPVGGALDKLLRVVDLSFGAFDDVSESRLFALLLVLFVFAAWPRREGSRGHRAFGMLARVFFVAYVVAPWTPGGALALGDRLPLILAAWLVAGLPVGPATTRGPFRTALAVVAVATAGNVAAHLDVEPDDRDAKAVIDALPEGARVYGLSWEPNAPLSLRRPMWAHYQAWYLVRASGDVAPSPFVTETSPVRYRDGTEPPRPAPNEEGKPWLYSMVEPYAKAFPTILVAAPRQTPDAMVPMMIFHERAALVRTMAHRGRFWAFDAREAFDAIAREEAGENFANPETPASPAAP